MENQMVKTTNQMVKTTNQMVKTTNHIWKWKTIYIYIYTHIYIYIHVPNHQPDGYGKMPIPSGKSTVSSKLSPSCRVRPFLVRFTGSKKMARLARRWRGSRRVFFREKPWENAGKPWETREKTSNVGRFLACCPGENRENHRI